jgi:DNA-binding GntR family transcriptional regulator
MKRAKLPADGSTLTSKVYAEIKRDLVRCLMRPGEALHEADLAARFKVSKTPVREALNQLAREGYLDVEPRRGYVVSPISLKDVQDVFQLRLMVEPAAAGLAAERGDEEILPTLQRLSRIEYRHGDPESYAAFLSANREFHTAVARATGNHRLASFVERLLEEMERFFHLGLDIRDSSEEMVHEHQELVDAIVGGDGKAAEDFMHKALITSRKRVIEAILESSSSRSGAGHLMRVL